MLWFSGDEMNNRITSYHWHFIRHFFFFLLLCNFFDILVMHNGWPLVIETTGYVQVNSKGSRGSKHIIVCVNVSVTNIAL